MPVDMVVERQCNREIHVQRDIYPGWRRAGNKTSGRTSGHDAFICQVIKQKFGLAENEKQIKNFRR